MSEARSRRIESEIQRVLAGLIAREVKDPRVGNVTITAVSLAHDMSTARVYFTPFASLQSPDQVCTGLTHAASFLRGELGRRLSLRHAPRLTFVFDDSVAGAARLTSLIDRAVAADRAGHHGADEAGAADAADDAGAEPAADSGDPDR
ncbi:MAG TPA: 30S ribosome-binding factor RbfA [Steroidobacteraceae bacterium]|jgi:ribosome-binding factor A|nr:30S ribosome-binding factor RbfA [Steroidobacteraceae bacterium]